MILAFLIMTVILFAAGAAIGSFLNVVIYRTVTEESWVVGRSKCEGCGRKISWFDNIPIISFLWLKARCRYCQRNISFTHPAIEFLVGGLFVWWYWVGTLFFQLTQRPFLTIQPIFWLCVGIILVGIAFADVLYMITPEVLDGALAVITVAYRVALVAFGVMQPQDLMMAVMGMVLVVALFGGLWLVTKGRGMGLGDVKLVAPLALLIGWPEIVAMVLIAVCLGAVVGVALMASGKAKKGHAIPFGPFLVIATGITLVWGSDLVAWYLTQLIS